MGGILSASATPPKLTTLQRRHPAALGALERPPGPHLTRSSRAFSLMLTTTVFSQCSSGWFDAYPVGQRWRANEPSSFAQLHFMGCPCITSFLSVRDATERLLEQTGRVAMAQLLGMARGEPSPPNSTLLPVELVARESCGCNSAPPTW